MEELRTNAALCLAALTKGNKISVAAAKKAGAVDAIATLFDGDPESEGAYLAAVAMQALGLSDELAQEQALSPGKAARESIREREEARADTLRAVWAMKEEPESWQQR